MLTCCRQSKFETPKCSERLYTEKKIETESTPVRVICRLATLFTKDIFTIVNVSV